MALDAYDLKSFYNTAGGRIVRRILHDKMDHFCPNQKGMRLLGYGYSVPYLRGLGRGGERFFALMPRSMGVHHWPSDDNAKNLVCLSEEDLWPIETNSIDRIVMVHALEYAANPQSLLEEAWRVLKGNGRLLMIVPSRTGLWTHAEWSPFGQGTPYSAAQIENLLRAHLFVRERMEKCLFIPPSKSAFFLRSARWWERFGAFVFPFFGGVHCVEASKQLYASGGTRVSVQEGNIARKRALKPQN